MPIWSLTKERVEKLLEQIGDKEIEIDTLIKLSKEDLWKRDLDEFINEWRFQLEDEDKRQKQVARLGRRESRKLKIGAAKGGRKRKQSDGSDDSDFGGPAKKFAASRPAVTKHVQPKQGLLSHLSPLAKANQPKPKAPKAPKVTTAVKKENVKLTEVAQPKTEGSEDIWMNVDGPSELGSDPPVAPIFTKAKVSAAATKKPAPRKVLEDDDESEEEIIRPTAASRKPRAAATKPVKYSLQSDTDDSNGDDLLFDVGKMVKGIGNTSGEQSRPLFSASMSRPGSSAGLPKKSSSAKPSNDIDGDDTDYSKLVPAKKGTTATARPTALSEDEDVEVDMDDDEFDIPPPKESAPAVKAKDAPVSKPKAKPAVKPKPAPAAPKKLQLSPAAKAYAKKQERNKKVVVSDEEDDEDEIEKVANEILEDEGESEEEVVVRAVSGRPGRRAAAVATKKAWVLDDDSEVDEGEEGETAEFDDDDESD